MKNLLLVIGFATVLSCKSTSNNYADNNNFYDKNWKLVELNHKKIVSSNRVPELIFKKDGSFTGNNGCNSIGGKFEFGEGNTIKFGAAFSTKMACMNTTIDRDFDKMMANTSHYKLQNDTLYLQIATKPIAKFVSK